ncbi:phosphonate C-P lyase system protein PhnG [Cohnella faecalis]|uniref:Phosphonate C-P lyase system protein PhnG n=1 Tax=Cohnella faecalis TaxID=2315694 RepID=A0A398CST2_9BACL|nr:phosphonate C-P lyase system protein PhnG [Cohnella faecalis]RIE05220.1 phosphonate C-P lyase system protein PhnG [Cohnella faecalis]
MKRKRRTEILVNGSAEVAAAMADEIRERYEVVVVEEPNHGLVMVKVRETARNSLFYLGEVLVTECKVRIGNAVGVGIVKGDEPLKAADLAVIDAAYAAELSETSAWTARLQSENERLEAERSAAFADLLRTQVSFETMDTD